MHVFRGTSSSATAGGASVEENELMWTNACVFAHPEELASRKTLLHAIFRVGGAFFEEYSSNGGEGFADILL